MNRTADIIYPKEKKPFETDHIQEKDYMTMQEFMNDDRFETGNNKTTFHEYLFNLRLSLRFSPPQKVQTISVIYSLDPKIRKFCS